MNTLFQKRAQDIIRWHNKGLITRDQAILKLKTLIAERKGNLSQQDVQKNQIASKLMQNALR